MVVVVVVVVVRVEADRPPGLTDDEVSVPALASPPHRRMRQRPKVAVWSRPIDRR
jgi:hypothetical protein